MEFKYSISNTPDAHVRLIAFGSRTTKLFDSDQLRYSAYFTDPELTSTENPGQVKKLIPIARYG